MAERLCAVIYFLGMISLITTTLGKPHIYTAGSSPIASTIEVHGISTFAQGLPGHDDSTERRDVLHHDNKHSPRTDLPSSQGTNSPPLTEAAKPKRGKWCSVVKSQVVSYVDLCKIEKYVIRSQQPCPYGTPDCQKTMYRLAQRPVYEIKRKFVTRLEWKCCPGYTGSTCEYADPNSIPIPLEHTSKAEKTQEAWENAEVTEIIQEVESQESLLEDIQNDIHEAASNLMELQNALGHNVTAIFPESHNDSDIIERKDLEIDDRLLREVFLPHVENFLKAHFNPVWTSFNKSLQSLNSMVKNLSENVESNRKRLNTFLENTVPKKDLYELGTKFESKVQENADKLDQLKTEMANHFHTQQAVMHFNFTMLKADTDMKLKRNLKMQQTQYSYLNFSMSELRRGQEQIQDDILDLSQNITLQCGPRDKDVVSSTSVNETLNVHEKEIQDLLTEQDVIFENISTLEKWIKELRTDVKKNSERVQVQFMEKSLIMEENKVFIQRQIMELNYTLYGIQEGIDELFKDCDCHKMNSDINALVDIQRNFSNQYRDILYGIEDVKQKEGSSKISLQNSVEDLSLELQLNRQSLTAQQEQGRNLALITTQLQTQATNFTHDLRFLRLENDQILNHIKLLDSSFSSLLEDAIRHERVLEALLGQEVLDLFSEDNPEALHVSIAKLYEMLNSNVDRIDRHQITIDSISDRLNFLEMQIQKDNSPTTATIFNVEQRNLAHMEPNHEASQDTDESEYSDVSILKKDIKNLSEKINKLETYLAEGHIYKNDTIEATLRPLTSSITSIKEDIANLRDYYNRHVQLFHKIFGNYEALLSSNVTLDIAQIQAIVERKTKKKLKAAELQTKKNAKKQREDQ